MLEVKVVKVLENQVHSFVNSVFGGEDLLKLFPDLLTVGCAVCLADGFWRIYIKDNGSLASDAFFSDDELQFLTIVREETLSNDKI